MLDKYYIRGMFGQKNKPIPDSDLESRVRALEASVKALDTEWTEMYDKFRRLHMRLSKRDRQDAPETTNGSKPGIDASPINPLALKLLGGHE